MFYSLIKACLYVFFAHKEYISSFCLSLAYMYPPLLQGEEGAPEDPGQEAAKQHQRSQEPGQRQG